MDTRTHCMATQCTQCTLRTLSFPQIPRDLDKRDRKPAEPAGLLLAHHKDRKQMPEHHHRGDARTETCVRECALPLLKPGLGKRRMRYVILSVLISELPLL